MRVQTPATDSDEGSIATAILRITLGVILVATWYDNLTKGLYGGDDFAGFLRFLGSEDGNGGSLGFVHSTLDAVVIPQAGFFGGLQLVVELVIGVALVAGLFTRLASLLATLFFLTLFLAYFGGEEWIWTYVLLTVSALTVYLGFGGRQLGVDRFLVERRGPSPLGNHLW